MFRGGEASFVDVEFRLISILAMLQHQQAGGVRCVVSSIGGDHKNKQSQGGVAGGSSEYRVALVLPLPQASKFRQTAYQSQKDGKLASLAELALRYKTAICLFQEKVAKAELERVKKVCNMKKWYPHFQPVSGDALWTELQRVAAEEMHGESVPRVVAESATQEPFDPDYEAAQGKYDRALSKEQQLLRGAQARATREVAHVQQRQANEDLLRRDHPDLRRSARSHRVHSLSVGSLFLVSQTGFVLPSAAEMEAPAPAELVVQLPPFDARARELQRRSPASLSKKTITGTLHSSVLLLLVPYSTVPVHYCVHSIAKQCKRQVAFRGFLDLHLVIQHMIHPSIQN